MYKCLFASLEIIHVIPVCLFWIDKLNMFVDDYKKIIRCSEQQRVVKQNIHRGAATLHLRNPNILSRWKVNIKPPTYLNNTLHCEFITRGQPVSLEYTVYYVSFFITQFLAKLELLPRFSGPSYQIDLLCELWIPEIPGENWPTTTDVGLWRNPRWCTLERN